MTFKNQILSAALIPVLATGCCCNAVKPAIAEDAAVEKKVEQVLKSMTVEQKAGQLVQITSDVISTN